MIAQVPKTRGIVERLFANRKNFRSGYAFIVAERENPANLSVGRAGPHGDCGLRGSIA